MSLGDSATPLGRVRGLGSAQHGGEHWLTERVTSVALLFLGTWLLASLLLLPKLDQRTLIEWLHAPSGAIPTTATSYWGAGFVSRLHVSTQTCRPRRLGRPIAG